MFPALPRRTIFLTAALLVAPAIHAQNAQWLQDQQTESKVQQALTDPQFVGSSIMSSVNNGVVKLYGNVRTEAEKEAAAQSLVGIPNVKIVTNNLAVAPSSRPLPTRPAVLAVGTALPIRLNSEIDTKTAKAGDTFQGTIAATVLAGGTVALPIGTPITGRVVDAKAAGRIVGAAELSLQLVSVQLAGQSVAITTRELSSKNNGRGTNTAARTGGGAALGAIIGGLAGGGTGAGIGAASGGAVGLGSNIIRPGQQIILKPEALLQFQTAAALELPNQPGPASSVVAPASITARQVAGVVDLPNQLDPATFDILTLRLGMTAREAADAITARIPGIQPAYPSPSNAQFTPGKRYTSNALYSTSRFKAFLTFTETYPFDPARPEQITSIDYEAVTPTDADRHQFRESILTKYGQPYREVKAVSALWCNKGTSVGSGPLACAPDTPILQLKGNQLILSDGGPYRRERAAWNAQTTTAPPI